MNSKFEQPYLVTQKIVEVKEYNPKYGDARQCVCGHSYYRHFDGYQNNEAVGCKYCQCDEFVEAVLTGENDEIHS